MSGGIWFQIYAKRYNQYNPQIYSLYALSQERAQKKIIAAYVYKLKESSGDQEKSMMLDIWSVQTNLWLYIEKFVINVALVFSVWARYNFFSR